MTAPLPFPWQDDYATGNGFVDEQHAKLLELANLLHVAVTAGKGYRIIGSAFTALLKYTQEHFLAEERLWARYKSPELDAHQREHAALTAELAALRMEGPAGIVYCTPNELTNWVERRLIRHFLVDDRTTYLGVQSKARGR